MKTPTRIRHAPWLFVIGLAIGCGGPTRYPTPSIEETGASRGGPPSLTQDGQAVTPQPAPQPAPQPQPQPQPAPPPEPQPRAVPPWREPAPQPAPPQPAPAPAPQPTPVPAPAPAAASEFGFLDGFAARLASLEFREPRVLAVLPPFWRNPLFHRWQVTRLGDDVASELLQRLARTLQGRVDLVSPELFERRLRATNRSLGDLDSPEAAVALAQRVGARYLVRGAIEDSAQEISIHLEAIDTQDLLPVEDVRQNFHVGEPFAQSIFQRHRDAAGQVIPGRFRIGALAEPVQLSLQAELQLLITDAVQQLLVTAGKDLEGLPVAVLLTQVPGEIRYEKFQRAFDRAIAREKERLMGLGLDANQAMSQGPVRVLGQNFQNLRQAEDYASEKDFQRKISDTGELRDTLSRIIFEITEDLGERRGIRVIPHDQLIDQAVLFSKEEGEKVREGVLKPETREYFKTRGAGALLFNELIDAGDSYEFVFQLRRMDDLSRLTPPVRLALEPRFAVQLDQFLKKTGAAGQ